MKAETTRRLLRPAWALRTKWTRPRCQVALNILPAAQPPARYGAMRRARVGGCATAERHQYWEYDHDP